MSAESKVSTDEARIVLAREGCTFSHSQHESRLLVIKGNKIIGSMVYAAPIHRMVFLDDLNYMVGIARETPDLTEFSRYLGGKIFGSKP